MAYRIERVRVRHARIRAIVTGTRSRPRLAVHFSGRHIYAQVIDDQASCTLASASTTEATLRLGAKSNVATAIRVGDVIAGRVKELNITRVVFDRGGFRYHGKVKALADAVRQGGVEF